MKESLAKKYMVVPLKLFKHENEFIMEKWYDTMHEDRKKMCFYLLVAHILLILVGMIRSKFYTDVESINPDSDKIEVGDFKKSFIIDQFISYKRAQLRAR